MTDKLFKILKKEFPVFKSIERVWIYGANERIYLNLIDKRFHNAKYFYNYDEIEKIANKIFDVPFVYETRGDAEKSIFFKPRNLNNKYEMNYDFQHITVHLPSLFPQITIDTGNRGSVELFDKQRDKYYGFVINVFNKFSEYAKR